MKQFRLSTIKCLYFAITLTISSLALGFIFTVKWRDEVAGHSVHPPQGVFRELLSDSKRPLLNQQWHKTATTRQSKANHHFSAVAIQHHLRTYHQKLNGELGHNEIDVGKDKNNGNPNELKGWIVLPGDVTVHIGNESTPHNYTYVINSEHICESFNQEQLKLLIFVESNAGNIERRQAIRDTWGLFSLQRALNYRVVFMLGQGTSQLKVVKESYRYGDIVQENFPESFQNLALKSVMGLKWSINHCSQADYVMKTDDDLLIHVPNLLEILKKHPHDENDLICHQNKVRKILRKKLKNLTPLSYQKYFVKESDLPGSYFPQYCAGMGYVFSAAAAHKLYDAAIVTPYFFIEDVYITGFCRHKAGLSLIDHPAITLRPTILPQQGPCAFKDGRVTSQEIKYIQMKAIWAEMNTQGFFCPEVIGYIR